MRGRRPAHVLPLVFVLVLSGVGHAAVDFGRDVRPILSSHCITCHGPDAAERQGELRLDLERHAKDPDSAAIVPGDPAASSVWQRITSTDADQRMPPPESKDELTRAEIETLREWIADGAPWGQHWAFLPPARPTPPTETSQAPWGVNPIDAFVLAGIHQAGWNPEPPADRSTWLRRLSLDLIGLPPTPTELSSFLADSSPTAYERQVDRLLRSQHYGERWARWWLDVARYADSDGFEKDKPREVWFYRDWVIQALNRDMPVNDFVIHQIAGDLLVDADQDSRVATGFLRNSMINEEGGIDPEQFRMEAMFDRMDAIGRAVLGLTTGCGQCHSHKYDPLSQTEYYRMFAFLNNCHEAQPAVYTPSEQAKIASLHSHIQRIEAELREQHPDWTEQLAEWEQQVQRYPQKDWETAILEFDDTTIGGQKFLAEPDGSYLAQGYAPTKFTPKMSFNTSLAKLAALRLEMVTNPNLPRSGPGRSIEGTFGLTEIVIEVAPLTAPDEFQKLKLASAWSDVNPEPRPLKSIYSDGSDAKRVTGPVAYAIDGDPLTAWTNDIGPGRSNHSRTAVFTIQEPPELAGGMRVNVYLRQDHGGWNSDDNQTFNLGAFRIAVTDAAPSSEGLIPPAIASIVHMPAADRSNEQCQELFAYWRGTQEAFQKTNAAIEALWQEHPAGTTQLVLQERRIPRPTFRLERGDFLQPREPTSPGVPEFLHALSPSAEPPRLQFARWLVDDRSPTTARAVVNRVWQAYFGHGIVDTSEDLGTQGELPSHPELLDWLAVEFMESGWSLKHLHRLIAMSATYRQSAQVTPEKQSQDPDNRRLARGPRFRVDAEVVRDIALAASGLLDARVGGRSVYPPAPEFLFQPPASYGPKTWDIAHDSSRYRRALYTFRFRSVPYPALEAFDSPNADRSCARRSRSNTPLQALTTLNETVYLECARTMALTITQGTASDEDR
ncbi:MAG: PSD1 domain-containing protein, partial [Planctomycetales bacterium]|nr:PSD1 domain-containing protein [Planctomycetales bacterium]